MTLHIPRHTKMQVKKNLISKNYHSKPKLGVVKKYQKKNNRV